MRSLSMIVYGLQQVAGGEDLSDRGWEPGPLPLLQRSGLPHLADERSDRSRTIWPHIFDVVHAQGRRWHLSEAAIWGVEQELQMPKDQLVGAEVLFFLDRDGDGSEADALRVLPSGARGEVTEALAVFYVAAPLAELSRFQSRAAQQLHADVGRALGDIGTVSRDRWNDAMHASELPLIVTAAVDPKGPPALSEVANRHTADASALTRAGWSVAIWQDAVVLTGAGERSGYWPRDISPEAALAGVGDAVLMRVIQRYVLHMLATRVGSAVPGAALDLQRVAHPIRSRFWWQGLSGDPLVGEVSDRLGEVWDLPDLAAETFAGLEVLANRDALDESRRQTQEAERLTEQAGVLNVLLFVFAAVSLVLATLTFIVDLMSDDVDALARVVFLVLLASVFATAGWIGTRRTAAVRRLPPVRSS